MIAAEIMTKNPVCVDPSECLAGVEGLLLKLRVRHIPVVLEGKLKGIISTRDLLPYLREEGLLSRAAIAVDIMTKHVVAARPDSDVRELLELILEHRVGALPVVRPDTQRVVGIVSYIDLLRAARGRVLGRAS